ncbi:MAG: TRAM domain-containing protein, partial [Bernardetiaceae bacterium]
RNQADVGKVFRVLVEGRSKRSADDLQGRNSANKKVVFPKADAQKGQYVDVLITHCTSATLLGHIVA